MVREQPLDEGDLLASNLALAPEALLVTGGHVRVQVLLARAPVQNLFEWMEGEGRFMVSRCG